jgi:hypothetical protein
MNWNGVAPEPEPGGDCGAVGIAFFDVIMSAAQSLAGSAAAAALEADWVAAYRPMLGMTVSQWLGEWLSICCHAHVPRLAAPDSAIAIVSPGAIIIKTLLLVP